MIFTFELLIFQLSIGLPLPKISCFHFLLVHNFVFLIHACTQHFLKSFVLSLVSSTYKESLWVCVAWFLTAYWFIKFHDFQKETKWFSMLAGKTILNFCLFLLSIGLKKYRFSLHSFETFTESYITKNILKLYFVCYLKWKCCPLRHWHSAICLQNISWFTVRTSAFSRRTYGTFWRHFLKYSDAEHVSIYILSPTNNSSRILITYRFFGTFWKYIRG